MKSMNLLLAMAASAAAAGSRFMMGAVGKSGPAAQAMLSSRNGGRRGAGMAAKRAAVKARNVARHRRACKGG
jgi:hypothetical protein